MGGAHTHKLCGGVLGRAQLSNAINSNAQNSPDSSLTFWHTVFLQLGEPRHRHGRSLCHATTALLDLRCGTLSADHFSLSWAHQARTTSISPYFLLFCVCRTEIRGMHAVVLACLVPSQACEGHLASPALCIKRLLFLTCCFFMCDAALLIFFVVSHEHTSTSSFTPVPHDRMISLLSRAGAASQCPLLGARVQTAHTVNVGALGPSLEVTSMVRGGASARWGRWDRLPSQAVHFQPNQRHGTTLTILGEQPRHRVAVPE